MYKHLFRGQENKQGSNPEGAKKILLDQMYEESEYYEHYVLGLCFCSALVIEIRCVHSVN